MIHLLLALILSCALSAQVPVLPPWYGGFACAWLGNRQDADINPDCAAPRCPDLQYMFDPNELWVGGYCDATDVQGVQPSVKRVGFQVRLGGSVFWQACSIDAAGNGLDFTQFSPLFLLSFYSLPSSGVVFPNSAPGADILFDSSAEAFFPSTFSIGLPSPDSWILQMPIPPIPALTGIYIHCQAVEPRFSDGLWHLSSGVICLIGT